MTNLNNLSIGQIKEVLAGAPEGAERFYFFGKQFNNRVDYYKKFFNYFQIWLPNHGWFPIDKELEIETISLSDLKTAIAEAESPINNLTIEQMKEILVGKPDGTTHVSVAESQAYYHFLGVDEDHSEENPYIAFWSGRAWCETGLYWNIDKENNNLIDLKDIESAIYQHEINEIESAEAHDTSIGDFEEWQEQQFENFLTENDFPIRKDKNGYLFSNRIVYEAWLESPELGLKRIQELKSTTVKLPNSLKLGDGENAQ